MANHKSAKKCGRKLAKRTLVNQSRKSQMRTFVKKFENLLSQPKTVVDLEQAKAALVKAESELMKAANKGVIHKNAASRKVSRLSKRLKSLVPEAS
jgi:small subunit ribosomal protein S20